MQIYVVTIEDEKSPRLSKFLNQNFFEQGNLPITKVGIKGGELSAKEYFDKAVKGRLKALTPGELGCTLSHIKALELFLASEEDFALILEDDAILPDGFTIESLNTELSRLRLPSNVLFSFGGIQMKESRKVRGEIKEYTIFDKAILEVVPDFYHRVNYTVSYLVDRPMAQTLLNYHKPIRKADDWSYLFDFDPTSHILMSFIIDHPVIESGESSTQLSSIESERVGGYKLMKSKYGTSIRKNIAKLMSKKYLF